MSGQTEHGDAPHPTQTYRSTTVARKLSSFTDKNHQRNCATRIRVRSGGAGRHTKTESFSPSQSPSKQDQLSRGESSLALLVFLIEDAAAMLGDSVPSLLPTRTFTTHQNVRLTAAFVRVKGYPFGLVKSLVITDSHFSLVLIIARPAGRRVFASELCLLFPLSKLPRNH